MEKYELIDMQKFDRADYFYYFMSVGTTIEFTAKINITKVMYQLYKVINIIENFKYDVVE